MIEHLKSGISISTHLGCGLKCSYCVLATLEGFNEGAILQIKPKKLVDELLNNKYYEKNKTPIMINNRTDPFIKEVIPYTLEILDLLIEKDIKSPILIISKFAPPVELKKYFDYLDICFFYSYSGIDSDFNYKKVFDDLKEINKIVPKESRYHYFRPIIPGVNDNLEFMKKIINIFVENNFESSVIAGFRVTNLNKHLIKEKSIDLEKIDYSHKLVNNNIYEINKWFFNSNYYIFRHTSCALAYHTKSFNKLNYYKKEGHCFSSCPNNSICSKKKININEIFKELKKRFKDKYDLDYDNDSIIIKSECSQELVAYIKNAFGCKVNATSVKLSKSEEVILGE